MMINGRGMSNAGTFNYIVLLYIVGVIKFYLFLIAINLMLFYLFT